jgi:hypothetical protein
VFSGDMAALNQGFAAQEDAAIRARAANQNYLATLAGQRQQARTARGAQELGMRGLDVQESLGTRGLDLQSRDQNARNAAALLALSNQQARDIAAIDNEGRRLSILASQGDRQAGLEADRLAVMREQIQAQSTMTQQQLRSAEKIAAISSGRLPPNVAIQTMRINEDIKAQNDLAAATAAKFQGQIKPDTAFWGNNSVKAEDLWKQMTPEQQMLVNYDPKATDPTKVFTAKTKPLLPTSGPQYTDADLRDQPGQGTGSTVLDILNFAYRNFDRSGKARPAGSQPAPGAAPGAPADGKPGSGAKPIPFKALIPDSGNQFTNTAPLTITNQPSATVTNQLPALSGLAAAGGIGDYADQGPASWSMRGQPESTGYLSGLTVGQQPASQMPEQMYAPMEAAMPDQPYDIQGAPQRMYNPRFRVPLGASADPNFNPAVGLYAAPDGSTFSEPLFRRPQPVRQPSIPAPMDYLPSLRQLTDYAQQSTTNTYNPNRRYEQLNPYAAY